MKGINIFTADDFVQRYKGNSPQACVKNTHGHDAWVLARPVGYNTSLISRLKIAWKVFIGKYDALKWYGQ